MLGECDMDDRFENVVLFLFGITGIILSQNVWVGFDYWKYRKFKGQFGNVCY